MLSHKKSGLLLVIMLILCWLTAPSVAHADSYKIAVTPLGDAVYHHYYEGVSTPPEGGGGPGFPTETREWWPGANPNMAGYANNMPNVPPKEESWYTLMEFDISGIGPGTITSARLNFFILNNFTGQLGGQEGLTHVPQALSSQPATGNAANDQFTGGIGIWSYSDQPSYYNGWASGDVTSFLQSDKAAGYNFSAYTMESSFGQLGSPNLTFASGEDSLYAPFLQVERTGPLPPAVPVPSSLLLTVTGLLGLMGWGRRLRKS